MKERTQPSEEQEKQASLARAVVDSLDPVLESLESITTAMESVKLEVGLLVARLENIERQANRKITEAEKGLGAQETTQGLPIIDDEEGCTSCGS